MYVFCDTFVKIVCGDMRGRHIHLCRDHTFLYRCWRSVLVHSWSGFYGSYCILVCNNSDVNAYVLVHSSFILNEVGCAMPQPLAASYLPQWPGSDAMPFCGKLVVDKVAWDTFYSKYFSFAPAGIIPSMLHTHSFIHH